jgi:hypothetical protein
MLFPIAHRDRRALLSHYNTQTFDSPAVVNRYLTIHRTEKGPEGMPFYLAFAGVRWDVPGPDETGTLRALGGGRHEQSSAIAEQACEG